MGKVKKLIKLLILAIVTTLNAKLIHYNITPKNYNQKQIKILDSKEFKTNLSEFSALAYDGDILYIISDKGYMYHFKISLKNNKISNLKLLKTIKLKGDSEGAIKKKKNKHISFEKKPKIVLYSKSGKKIKNIKLPKILQNIKNYKSKNKALESVAYSKKYGVVTAPEKPFKDKCLHTIYTTKKKNYTLKSCHSITAMEFSSKNKLLVLLRDYSFFSRKSTIIELNLKTKKQKTLLKMDSNKGWKIDNFEGLTKVGKNTYLIVSDDNNSPFQKTIFVLFQKE